MMLDKNDNRERLIRALAQIETEALMGAFLDDLCTPQEVAAMAERLEIARLLRYEHLSYRDISHRTGASTTTVARVARFLKQENNGGYDRVLENINKSNRGLKNDTDIENRVTEKRAVKG